MNPIRKWIKRALSGGSVVVGGAAVGHGLLSTADAVLTKGLPIDKVPNYLGYQYTGYSADTNTFDTGQTFKSIGIIVTGIIAAKLMKWGARQL